MIDFARETPVLLVDLAGKLGVDPHTVREWARVGSKAGRKLESTKLGGRRFTSMEAVNRFQDSDAQASSFNSHASETSADFQRAAQAMRERHGLK